MHHSQDFIAIDILLVLDVTGKPVSKRDALGRTTKTCVAEGSVFVEVMCYPYAIVFASE